MSERFDAVWLLALRDRAEAWLTLPGNVNPHTPRGAMSAYLDLLFAYGLARLGEAGAARELVNRAAGRMPATDDSHQFLLGAYRYRIEQAIATHPLSGPLPAEQVESLSNMDRMPRYIVDRLRQHSRILEPDERVDPNRYWGGRISELDRELAGLTDLTDRDEIVRRVNALLALQRGSRARENTARILRAALNVAPRVGEEFARAMLERVAPAYDALPEALDLPTILDRLWLLETALEAAARCHCADQLGLLLARWEAVFARQANAPRVLETLTARWLGTLRRLGLRDEIDASLNRLTELAVGTADLGQLATLRPDPAQLGVLLHIAGGWEFLGLLEVAEPIFTAVRRELFGDDLSTKERTLLTCAYVAVVGQTHVAFARQRLEELFDHLTGVRDTYTTNHYYSLSQLDVIEAVVLAICANPTVRGGGP